MFVKKALAVSVLGLSLAVAGLVGEVTHAQAAAPVSKAPVTSALKVSYNVYKGLYQSDKVQTPFGAKVLSLTNSVNGQQFTFKVPAGPDAGVIGKSKASGNTGSVEYTDSVTGIKIGTGKLTLLKEGMVLTFVPVHKVPGKTPPLPNVLAFHKVDVHA